MKPGHLFEHFSIIKDLRQSWKIEHKLFDILLLTICAVIAGADGWEDIEDQGKIQGKIMKKTYTATIYHDSVN